MIQLETKKGVVRFDEYTIAPEDTVNSILNRFAGYFEETKPEGYGFTTFKLDIPSHENVYSVGFFEDKLNGISIFSKEDPYEGGEGNIRILKELGGANNYVWGSVALNEDNKAGFTYVAIIYV